MRKILTIALCSVCALVARATQFSFVPSDNDLGDLDHKDTYIWGISDSTLKSQVTSGNYSITSATIKITGLYNWDVADTNNMLFINLLGNPKSGLTIVQDNPGDNGDNQGTVSNYFAGNISSNYGVYYNRTAILLTTFHDGNNNNTPTTFTFNFSGSQLSTLQSYIQGVTASGDADFGLGFDPDCHFYNTGVCLTVTTTQNVVPDGGMTLAMLGLSVTTLAFARRRFRA